MTNTQSPAPGVAAEVEAALKRAFSLGQTYWQQADSEFVSQHRKSDETRRKFDQLVEETMCAVLASRTHAPGMAGGVVPVAEVAAGNLGSRLMWHTSDAQELTAVGTLLYAHPPAEKQEPVMTIGFDESEKCRSLPFGMKLYAHPSPALQVPADGPLDKSEQEAVLQDLRGIACLINRHDCWVVESEARDMDECVPHHEARIAELLALGRAIIAEDPAIWHDEDKAPFKLRYSETAPQVATPGAGRGES